MIYRYLYDRINDDNDSIKPLLSTEQQYDLKQTTPP